MSNKASVLAYLAGVERLVYQGSPSSFPTASFARHRSAQLIPAICFYTFYVGARDTLVTFDDACPTSVMYTHNFGISGPSLIIVFSLYDTYSLEASCRL